MSARHHASEDRLIRVEPSSRIRGAYLQRRHKGGNLLGHEAGEALHVEHMGLPHGAGVHLRRVHLQLRLTQLGTLAFFISGAFLLVKGKDPERAREIKINPT